jgi:imidazoleglycerol-phosphate dehydratase
VEIDQAHLVEGPGRVLGQALREAVADRSGIRRVASAAVPVEEALALCAVDLAGRPFVAFSASFAREEQDGLELDLVPDFFRALAEESRATWHLRLDAGEHEPHKVEALFKAAGRALGDAIVRDPARGGVTQSTKRPRA